LMVSQVVALAEPMPTGRPWAGHGVYLGHLAILAALISVFNARRPGNGAWSLLMGLLFLVFLIPWLQGWGLVHGVRPIDRLRLEAPWSWFFLALAVAGVSNYAPTRYGLSAFFVGGGFVTEWIGLTYQEMPLEVRSRLWTVAGWWWSSALVVAVWRSRRWGGQPRSGRDLDRVWFRFRDHWGLVWAVRVADRLNAMARSSHWALSLEWDGLKPSNTNGDDKAEADPSAQQVLGVLIGLLRRFANRSVLQQWSEPEWPEPDDC